MTTFTINDVTITGSNDAPTLGFVDGFVQDFQTGTEGVVAEGDYGAITTVASGTNGIVTADGGDYALITETASGPFTRFDGYRAEFIDGLTASVDVYLDVNWNAGSGFDYSVAANGTDGANQRDFVFHVTKDSSTRQLLVGASNNSGFAPREDLESINSHAVTGSGWYTLQHVFRDAGGHLAVDFSLIDADGDIVWSTTIETTDAIPTEVGGNRYGWFTDVTVSGGLAIDNLTLGGEVSGAVTEIADNRPGEGSVNLAADGLIPFTDVDIGDNHVVSVEAGGNGYLGTFQAEVDNTATLDGEGSVTWSFVVADGAVEHLGEGDTLTQVYTVTVDDGHGGTVSQDVTVTITGSNDGATIAGTDSGTVVEDGQHATGTLTVSDIDSGENELQPIAAGTAGDNGYGSFEVLANGTWTYTLDNAHAAVQALPAGATLTDTITVTSEDGTDTHVVTVTITGSNDEGSGAGDRTTNDVPEIISGSAFTVAENTASVGTVTATDSADTLVYAIVAGDDAFLFNIDATTGVLSFKTAPDFEEPSDANGNNAYQVTVRASDGTADHTQALTVTVTNETGVTIEGTKKKDTIGDSKTVKGPAMPTGEEDTITGKGKSDKVHGLGGNDMLYGGKGKDKLYGDDGDDSIRGELGRDVMFGGDGSDTFQFIGTNESVKGKNADLIRDFSNNEGDLIDLAGIDAKEGGADNTFKYIGDDDFTGKKGQLQFDNRKLTGDTDGDGKADFMIKVEANKLVGDDFIL